MALFGLIGGDKPTPKNIEKQVSKVKERYAQPEYRRGAMDRLLEWGTPESLEAVMQRFTVVAQSPHWDEEEKRWLVDELAQRGDPARQACVRFLKRENYVAFAAKALRRLVDEPTYLSDLVEALRAHPADDHRSVQGKQELVAALGEAGDARSLEAIVPYLDDHGDDVRCTVVDVIEKHAVTSGYPRLVETLTEDHHSARVLRHIAGAVARLGLDVDATKPLAPAVAEDFTIQNGKLARHA
jgi:hypothetical protein